MANKNRASGDWYPTLECDEEVEPTAPADGETTTSWPEVRPRRQAGLLDSDFHVPADVACGSLVRRQIQDLATEACMSPGDTADLILAVSEAFNNAVRHGTSRPGDMIELSADIRRGKAVIEMRYRGERFAVLPPELPPPTASSGRGRYIMAMLLDQIEYQFDTPWTVARLVKHYRRMPAPQPGGGCA
jgi:anti-sigma regulatory factor (Ser/Thr protein kinase)